MCEATPDLESEFINHAKHSFCFHFSCVYTDVGFMCHEPFCYNRKYKRDYIYKAYWWLRKPKERNCE